MNNCQARKVNALIEAAATESLTIMKGLLVNTVSARCLDLIDAIRAELDRPSGEEPATSARRIAFEAAIADEVAGACGMVATDFGYGPAPGGLITSPWLRGFGGDIAVPE